MDDYRQTIIRKYRRIARLPDFLFAFTIPLRKKAVHRLELQPGAVVIDMGCSSGANFALLVAAVGAGGKIIGVDLSPDMIAEARKRIEQAGWDNIQLIEAAAEAVDLDRQADGLLLFAMHDVLTSAAALDHILQYVKPGGRVVAAGPKLPTHYPARLLQPLIGLVFKRFAVSQQDRTMPWRLLAERVPDLALEENLPGILYLAYGRAA